MWKEKGGREKKSGLGRDRDFHVSVEIVPHPPQSETRFCLLLIELLGKEWISTPILQTQRLPWNYIAVPWLRLFTAFTIKTLSVMS